MIIGYIAYGIYPSETLYYGTVNVVDGEGNWKRKSPYNVVFFFFYSGILAVSLWLLSRNAFHTCATAIAKIYLILVYFYFVSVKSLFTQLIFEYCRHHEKNYHF